MDLDWILSYVIKNIFKTSKTIFVINYELKKYPRYKISLLEYLI